MSLVIGPRSQANADALWQDCAARPDGGLPALIATDEYPVCAGAILRADGLPQAFPRMGRRGRPRPPRLIPPTALVYAMVHQLRRRGRVVQVTIRRVFGTARQVAPARSGVSTQVNTSIVERFNATVRPHHSRKARKVDTFSNAFIRHHAMSWFGISYYHPCCSHPGLRRHEEGRWRIRAPAMAAGLSDHVWTLHEFLRYPPAHSPL